jgi:ecotin
MNLNKKKSLAGFLLFSITSVFSQNNMLKDFPQTQNNLIRQSILLPKNTNENDLKVEFYIEKKELVDVCNSHFLIGEITEKTLEGFGYTYYEFESKGVGSTLMGCNDNSKKIKSVKSTSKLVNYNSKLPIVIYTSKENEIKYRIWRADKTISTLKSVSPKTAPNYDWIYGKTFIQDIKIKPELGGSDFIEFTSKDQISIKYGDIVEMAKASFKDNTITVISLQTNKTRTFTIFDNNYLIDSYGIKWYLRK